MLTRGYPCSSARAWTQMADPLPWLKSSLLFCGCGWNMNPHPTHFVTSERSVQFPSTETTSGNNSTVSGNLEGIAINGNLESTEFVRAGLVPDSQFNSERNQTTVRCTTSNTNRIAAEACLSISASVPFPLLTSKALAFSSDRLFEGLGVSISSSLVQLARLADSHNV